LVHFYKKPVIPLHKGFGASTQNQFSIKKFWGLGKADKFVLLFKQLKNHL